MGPRFTDRLHIISIILIAVVSIAIYSSTLKNGFVYDDEYTIVNNTLIKDIGNLPKLLTKDYFPYSGEMSYRPVVTFTYFIDYAIYGMKPWGYHLTNVLLHAVNGIILYVFFTLLIEERKTDVRSQTSGVIRTLTCTPLIIAVLFVTHPVLTEAVNAISFREDLLAFLFYMSTLVIYLVIHSRYNAVRSTATRSIFFILSCLLYSLAILSKEMAFTLPLIVCCYEWIYGNRDTRKLHSFIVNRYNIGYVIIILAYAYLRFSIFFNPVEENIPAWPLAVRLLTVPQIIFKYIALLIAPVSLSADYRINPITSFLLPIFFLLTITACIILIKKIEYKNDMVFGLFFLLITLIPVYNIVPIVNPVAERYLYLPIVGFMLVAGAVINIVATNCRTERRSIYILIPLAAIFVIYSFATMERNKVWRDTYTLWKDTIDKTPDSVRGHYNLGLVYAEQGKFDHAIGEFEITIKLQPSHVNAHNNLGNAYYEEGRIDEAIKEYLAVLKSKPDHIEARNNLGVAIEALKEKKRQQIRGR